MKQSNSESEQAEAVAQAAWEKILVVRRIISICGILIVFDVGKALWPSWLVEYQLQFFLAILFLVILSIFAAPYVVATIARSHSDPK